MPRSGLTEYGKIACDLQRADTSARDEHAHAAIGPGAAIAERVRDRARTRERLDSGHRRYARLVVAARGDDYSREYLTLDCAAFPGVAQAPTIAARVALQARHARA